jgi:TonB family protein
MTIVDATATGTASTAGLTATTATAPVIDAALVNEEVQRRIAAERARLEQQARATAPAATPQPQPVARPVTPQPQPVPPPRQQQPQPAVAETQTAPQPAPQPAAEPARPAPQPAAETPRVQEGDLVTDLSNLVPARMIRRADLPYPPLARMQRVEGRVLVSALISETGAVLETRVIVPIKKPVGLNEAAQAIVKRSTFSPPTKDGVKVKAWTTVPIDFKL